MEPGAAHGGSQHPDRGRLPLLADQLLNYATQVALNVTEETTRQALPTVTGFAAKQAIAALRTHNINTAPLLHRAGLSEQDLAAAGRGPLHNRVSAVGQARFIDYAAEALDDSAFGLHLAEQTDPHDAGILFYVASAAKNFGEALALFERYFRIVNEAVRFKLTRTGEGLAAEVTLPSSFRRPDQARASLNLKSPSGFRTLRMAESLSPAARSGGVAASVH
jgi:hypothetical protein